MTFGYFRHMTFSSRKMCRGLPCGLNKMQNLGHRVTDNSLLGAHQNPLDFCWTSVGLLLDFHWTSCLVDAIGVWLDSGRSPLDFPLISTRQWLLFGCKSNGLSTDSPSGQSVGLTVRVDKHRTSTGMSPENSCTGTAEKCPFWIPKVQRSPVGVRPEKGGECKDLQCVGALTFSALFSCS